MASPGPLGPVRACAHEARAARLSYLLAALAGAGAVACNHPAEATIITCGNPDLGGCGGYGGDLAATKQVSGRCRSSRSTFVRCPSPALWGCSPPDCSRSARPESDGASEGEPRDLTRTTS